MTATEKLFHFALLLFTMSGQSKQKSDQCDDATTSQQCVPAKKRKVFEKAELASFHAVFKASNGFPSPSLVERLADSMGMAKDQVINKTLPLGFDRFLLFCSFSIHPALT